MKADLTNYLLADAGLTARVGNRIKWELRPQGSILPALGLTMVSAPRAYTMKSRDRLTGYLVQMDVWAGTLATREAATEALILALDDMEGSALKAAFIENQRDSTEVGQGPDAAGASNFYRSSLDVRVWHREN